MPNFFCMCISEVAIKVCILELFAGFIASPAASISFSIALAKAQIVLFFIFEDILNTASKSPLLAIGNPASITSTFNFSSTFAMRSFSETFIDAPGLCSPSLNVVSNITNLSLSLDILIFFFTCFVINIVFLSEVSEYIHNKSRK